MGWAELVGCSAGVLAALRDGRCESMRMSVVAA